jgi:predicted CoA-substrate-specific enzyme activase
MEKCYLGIDVGSVSTNIVAISDNDQVLTNLYLRTEGKPIIAIQKGLEMLQCRLPKSFKISGVGSTGSARYLTNVVVGGDCVKNEITSHAVAALHINPNVRTVMEIGGQDSKIIILQDGVVTDFAMNTVCAAGTGSFLDQQANRLNLSIEELGKSALEATVPIRIAGRCAVFAESDMIHKQQMGYSIPDIVYGLCQALVRNYLNNLGKGKNISSPVIFQGGVAANLGMRKAFEEALNVEIIIPEYYSVMGALGVALLAKEQVERTGYSNFYGFGICNSDYKTRSFNCNSCPNVCEIVEISVNRDILGRWGDRCGKWSQTITKRFDKLA